MKHPRSLVCLLLSFCVLGARGPAQIERLDLGQMLERCDDAVQGRVISRHAFRVDHDVDGHGLYFTTLRVEGRSLVDGRAIAVDVTHLGGWVEPGQGVWNSEAPALADTEPGRNVVVFTKWTDDMSGGVPANAPYAGHGGVFRVVAGPGGPVVLGRGPGFAVSENITLAALQSEIGALHEERR